MASYGYVDFIAKIAILFHFGLLFCFIQYY